MEDNMNGRCNKFSLLLYTLNVLAAVATLALLACSVSTQQLSPAAQNVHVTKAEPPEGCAEIGPIEAVSGGGCGMYGAKGTYEDAYNILRNKAAEMGANHVRMDAQVPPHLEGGCQNQAFVIRGVAFRCQ
jgi:hypothetical protein